MRDYETALHEFYAECDEISAECEAEGYPSNGSVYDLRVDNIMHKYPELFSDDEDEEE